MLLQALSRRIRSRRDQILSNPLVALYTHRPTLISANRAMGIGFAANVLALPIGFSLIFERGVVGEISLLASLMMLVYALIPALIAYTAVSMTGDWLGQRYTLLHITPLTDLKLLCGYTASALYICRPMLAFIAGSFPTVAVSLMYAANSNFHFWCMQYLTPECDSPSLADGIARVVTGALLAMNLWGVIFLAAVFGAGLMVAFRLRFLAAMIAVTMITLLTFFPLGTVMNVSLAVGFWGMVLFLPVPYLVGGGIIFALQPLVRRYD